MDYPKFNIKTLENKMRIVSIPIKNAVTVKIAFYIDVGYFDENKKETGCAHFLEHMIATYLREGCEAKKLYRKGIYFRSNASTSTFRTSYYLEIESKHFEDALDLIIETYTNRFLDKDILERERNAVIVEMMGKANKKEDYIFSVIFPKLIFGANNNLKRDALQHYKNAYKITLDDLTQFMNKFYIPERTIFIISGNYDKKIFSKYINRNLKGIKNNHVKIVREIKPKITKNININLVEVNKPIYTTIINFYLFPPNKYVDKYLAYFISQLLSGIGSQSILFNRLRSQLGLTYSPQVEIDFNNYYGNFIISFDSKKKDLMKIITEIIGILKFLKSHTIDKSYFKLCNSKYLLSINKTYNNIYPGRFIPYANKIFNNEEIFTPMDIYDKFHKKTNTKKINDFSSKYFIKERCSVVIMGKPLKEIKLLNKAFNLI